jgi:hypothetical protein
MRGPFRPELKEDAHTENVVCRTPFFLSLGQTGGKPGPARFPFLFRKSRLEKSTRSLPKVMIDRRPSSNELKKCFEGLRTAMKLASSYSMKTRICWWNREVGISKMHGQVPRPSETHHEACTGLQLRG